MVLFVLQTPLAVAGNLFLKPKVSLAQLTTDLNATDTQGRTALIRAVKAKKLNLIHTLIQQDVDLTVLDDHGHTAFSILNRQKGKSATQARLYFQLKILGDLLKNTVNTDEPSTWHRRTRLIRAPQLGNEPHEAHTCISCMEKFIDPAIVDTTEYSSLCKPCGLNFLNFAIKDSKNELIYFPTTQSGQLKTPVTFDQIRQLGATIPQAQVFIINQMTHRLRQIENFRFCPIKNCKNGQIVQDGSTWFHCVMCNFSGCINCAKPHDTLQPDNEDCLTAAGYKKCPTCEAYSIKVSGCHLMTCPNCLTHWNWDTGEKFQQGVDQRRGHKFLDELYPRTWESRTIR